MLLRRLVPERRRQAVGQQQVQYALHWPEGCHVWWRLGFECLYDHEEDKEGIEGQAFRSSSLSQHILNALSLE